MSTDYTKEKRPIISGLFLDLVARLASVLAVQKEILELQRPAPAFIT
jgi:hypothetical protein